MNAIKWTYNEMYKWYTKQHKINETMSDDIKAIIYESKRPSKKDSTQLEPFIKKNIVWTGLSPMQDDSLFSKKLYLVYDDNRNKKQSLYFVFPTEKIAENTTFLAADHFTFVLDKSDKKKPCHFHSTLYMYDKTSNIMEGEFLARHRKDFMADNIRLPEDIGTIFQKHQKTKSFLIDLITFPWKQLKHGGTRNQKQSQEKARYMNDNEAFCNKWQEDAVKTAVVFGIKRDDKICWTATIYKKGRLQESYGYTGLYYETSILSQEEDYEKEFQRHFVDDFVSNV